MTESDAIARLKGGDIGGLEALVGLYQVRAIRTSYLISYDYALAEDIVQAAFVRAYERIGQLEDSRPFGPWFLRSVVNDTLMALRRRLSVSLDGAQISEAVTSDLEPDVAQALEAAETREAVWQAVSRLSPAQRAAVVLRYYLDLSDKEVAARLDVPPGTVRRRLHDARERLRDLLPAWIAQPVEE